ncbi:hypothetical protein PG991_006067 [Apiospora marii]|uniref:Mid2 domain-containing protein n=1 Tax=Apiospora marii TaxID=335849 RepID=A0ABR1SB92_9PEZI
MDEIHDGTRSDIVDRYRGLPRMVDEPPANQTEPSATSSPTPTAPPTSVTTPSSTSSASTSRPSPAPQSSASDGPSPSVVVGSIIGCIAVPILALLVIVWWRRRRHRRFSLAYDAGFGNAPYDNLRSAPSGHENRFPYSDTHSPPYSDAIPPTTLQHKRRR